MKIEVLSHGCIAFPSYSKGKIETPYCSKWMYSELAQHIDEMKI